VSTDKQPAAPVCDGVAATSISTTTLQSPIHTLLIHSITYCMFASARSARVCSCHCHHHHDPLIGCRAPAWRRRVRLRQGRCPAIHPSVARHIRPCHHLGCITPANNNAALLSMLIGDRPFACDCASFTFQSVAGVALVSASNCVG